MIREIHKKRNVIFSYRKGLTTFVGVRKKQPLSELPGDDRIPKIAPDGTQTDVIVVPKLRTMTYCNQESGGCGRHKQKQRPIVGGLSFCPSESGAATLGMIVQDATDYRIVGLSNNHVIGPVLGVGSAYPDFYVEDITTIECLQPSPLDGGLSPADALGYGKRAVPTIFGGAIIGVNTVDAAICQIVGIDMYAPGIESLLMGGYFPFAQKYEYFEGSTVVKAGRTTGLSTGEILATNAAATLIYGADIPANHSYYENIIAITSENRFVSPGDSGSVILCKIEGQWKIIGLLMGGSEDGKLCLACHIQDVAELLQIQQWEGQIFLPESYTGAVRVDRYCYQPSGEIIAGDQTHTVVRNYTNCYECLSDLSRKTLFGNVL
jgi:hypothetical protein